MMSSLRMCAPRLVLAACMVAMPFGAAIGADEHFAKDGVAIGGYDPVAFHTMAKPTPGTAQFTAEYQGVRWQFASAAHRDLFAANPAKFAPAYGGWCSAGASKGKKVPTKAEFWAVVDGQLYLNSTEAAHNKLFLADTASTIRKGEMQWKSIFATPASQL